MYILRHSCFESALRFTLFVINELPTLTCGLYANQTHFAFLSLFTKISRIIGVMRRRVYNERFVGQTGSSSFVLGVFCCCCIWIQRLNQF